MSTTKFQGVVNPTTNPTQTGKTKDDIPTLKNKVTELEHQINDYKIKLDELRRSNTTTVVKLEKEYVNTIVPAFNRPEKTKSCEKCEEFERILETERKSNAQLKKMIEHNDNTKQQLQQSSTTNPNSCLKCSDLKQLLDIEKENNLQITQQCQSQKKQKEQERNAKEIFERSIEIIQSEIIQSKKSSEVFRYENQEYKKKFELIKKEHDEKMADLCNREDEAKKEIETWEQMYREWMATMERRVNNLQVTNEELQTWLHNEKDTSQQHRSTHFENQRR
ncbi:unnamed protein product [Rotaria sordida]|uniref:Uncharacterized protein n=1 Tax=Rotaria sordida TaxID=392033 RepID=A0A815FBF9_9BILA|nr:unnamed protein product [Rotaria sordida]CAF4075814.1 unnamed protein product [Rotaria sordida]